MLVSASEWFIGDSSTVIKGLRPCTYLLYRRRLDNLPYTDILTNRMQALAGPIRSTYQLNRSTVRWVFFLAIKGFVIFNSTSLRLTQNDE